MKELSQKELSQVSGGNSLRLDRSNTGASYASGRYGVRASWSSAAPYSNTFNLANVGVGYSNYGSGSRFRSSATGNFNFGRNNNSTISLGYNSHPGRFGSTYTLGYSYRW